MKKMFMLCMAMCLSTALISCGKEELSVDRVTSGASAGAVSETATGTAATVEAKEWLHYVSKDYFYTDFEGESVVQTDVKRAYIICQRNLRGELTDSYEMGEKFNGLFYVDENWLYYSELDHVEPDEDTEEELIDNSKSVVYRVPLSYKNGKEIPDFQEKELVFTEPARLTGSDFMENSFLQIVDDIIYYGCGDGLGTYNLKSKEQKHYPVHDKEEDYINAAGTRYMIAEGEKQCDVLTDLKTGKSEVMKTQGHPWLRLGREYYFRFPYVSAADNAILLDLNSGETMDMLSQKEAERVAEEMQIPWDKEWLSTDGWDGLTIHYIGYYDHRLYAELRYPTAVKDKKGKKVTFWDAVCVSRDMDKEKEWTVEREITAHARKKIRKYYRQVEEGSYKIEKDEDGEAEEYEVEIGEGIANGIFYFEGLYKKDGKLSKDIYDLKQREIRVIGRNSPETFYPFYENSHVMMYNGHMWQGIRRLAPILSQTEELYDQEQKRSQP